MNEQEFLSLRHKVEETQKIREAISKINKILDNIDNVTGKCEEIRFNFYGVCEHGGFGIEPGEHCTQVQTITPETLGISEQTYIEWFTSPLINHLKDLKTKLQEEFDKMKI